jgi:hypothetical protein
MDAALFNPIVQVHRLVRCCPGSNQAWFPGPYVWERGFHDVGSMLVLGTFISIGSLVFYGVAACWLARSAMRRFRRHAFA